MKKKPIFTKFTIMLLLTGATLVLFHFVIGPHVRAQPKVSSGSAKPPTAGQLAALSNSINATISANPGIDVGVATIDIHTGQTEQYGITNPFEAASTAKLITATDYLHHVEDGDDSLHDTVNGASAQYELQQMIEVSDDNAWQAFNEDMGHPDLLSYATGVGITNYDPDDNTLPPSGIALLLQKLYSGQLLNKSDTQLLLGYMANANYTNYIKAVTPANAKFYHKAGILDDRVHDAAIIDDGKHAIVLVIFTKDEDDDSDTSPTQTQIIQQISAAVLHTYAIK